MRVAQAGASRTGRCEPHGQINKRRTKNEQKTNKERTKDEQRTKERRTNDESKPKKKRIIKQLQTDIYTYLFRTLARRNECFYFFRTFAPK